MRHLLIALMLSLPAGASEVDSDVTMPLETAIYRQVDSLYRHSPDPDDARKARELLEARLKNAPLDQGLLWRYARASVLEASSASWLRRRKLLSEARKAAAAALDIDPSDKNARYWMTMAEGKTQPPSSETAKSL